MFAIYDDIEKSYNSHFFKFDVVVFDVFLSECFYVF